METITKQELNQDISKVLVDYYWNNSFKDLRMISNPATGIISFKVVHDCKTVIETADINSAINIYNGVIERSY